jgi:hypothetical protein
LVGLFKIPGGYSADFYDIRDIDKRFPGRDSAAKKQQDDTIASLVQRAQRGDEQAFAALYQLHSKRVFAVCLRMTKDVADAEDLTQEAFLQVFRSINSFRGDSAFST